LPRTRQGTPIISNNRVFVTSHEPISKDTKTEANIVGICFDAGAGEELWRRLTPRGATSIFECVE
jgi:hypothetical protein